MSVVFTDAYTVASDTALESYPSGSPDYSSLLNGNSLTVNAANDRVQVEVSGTDVLYRCLDTACPTTDYKASVDVGVRTGYDGGYVLARCAGASSDCYALLRASSTTWELYRVDSGGFTLLTSYSVSTTDNTTQAIALKATGTSTVALTPTIAGSDRTVFNDSNANRKQSGRWGLGVYDSAANAASWVDNASIDDLAAGGTATVTGAGNIATAEAFGTATLSARRAISGAGSIASAEAFGTPTVSWSTRVLAAGIASAEAFGTAVVTFIKTISPTGIASGEAFGTATVSRDGAAAVVAAVRRLFMRRGR